MMLETDADPLETDAEQNCLLHALSLALAGFHDRANVLRWALHHTMLGMSGTWLALRNEGSMPRLRVQAALSGARSLSRVDGRKSRSPSEDGERPLPILGLYTHHLFTIDTLQGLACIAAPDCGKRIKKNVFYGQGTRRWQQDATQGDATQGGNALALLRHLLMAIKMPRMMAASAAIATHGDCGCCHIEHCIHRLLIHLLHLPHDSLGSGARSLGRPRRNLLRERGLRLLRLGLEVRSTK